MQYAKTVRDNHMSKNVRAHFVLYNARLVEKNGFNVLLNKLTTGN